MSKNALGLCFMGDTLNLQLPVRDPKQLLSSIPMRLLKMKDSKDARSERHPLESVASEGMVWRWMPYSPGGPPLHSPGEFSVPIDQGEVDAILDAAEHGRAVPVFTQQSTKVTKKSTDFLAKKDEGNAFFKAGDFVKAIAAYDAALAEDAAPADAAVAHSNAAQALLKLGEADAAKQKPCAAEALRRAREAIELDPTNIKAFARCAAACDVLEEHEAAAEFRQHLQRCEAAAEATRAARRAEAEERQQQHEEQRRKMAAAMQEKARCEALLERERQLERQREEESNAHLSQAEATRLSSMLGMDSTLAGMPSVGGK
ncbi:Protein unc-45 homolog A (Unc-45A) (Smooth muscle cell-associated protein 1) (SMAP-1) [Durusdinium trenchii]